MHNLRSNATKMMMSSRTLFLSISFLLWTCCVVLYEHQKRDVHRIIIQERVPRSHKKAPHHHKHSSHHSAKRANYNDHKNGAKIHISAEDSKSYEDKDSGSYSTENSHEDIFQRHKGYKLHTKQKTIPKWPSYPVHLDVEETRQEPYRGDIKPYFHSEWIPLSSDPLHQHVIKQKNKKQNERKIKKQQGKSHPVFLELTTHYPVLHFEPSIVHPQLTELPNAFPNFNVQKNIAVNQSPLIGAIEPQLKFSDSQLKDNSDRLSNHRPTYGVTEDDTSDISSYILVPENHPDVSEEQQLIESIKNEKTKLQLISQSGIGEKVESHIGVQKILKI